MGSISAVSDSITWIVDRSDKDGNPTQYEIKISNFRDDNGPTRCDIQIVANDKVVFDSYALGEDHLQTSLLALQLADSFCPHLTS
jgi:hypothetical protein